MLSAHLIIDPLAIIYLLISVNFWLQGAQLFSDYLLNKVRVPHDSPKLVNTTVHGWVCFNSYGRTIVYSGISSVSHHPIIMLWAYWCWCTNGLLPALSPYLSIDRCMPCYTGNFFFWKKKSAELHIYLLYFLFNWIGNWAYDLDAVLSSTQALHSNTPAYIIRKFVMIFLREHYHQSGFIITFYIHC